MTDTCSIEEVQIVRMAREYRGEIIAVGATLLSMLATRLAKYCADDDLILQGGDSWACWDCEVAPYLEHDEYLCRSSAQGQFEWSTTFDFVRSNRFRIFTSPAQVDQYGNANLSAIGNWDRPTVQMIGSRGLPDDLWRVEVLHFHVPHHSPRVLVEEVDFVSSFGHGTRREQTGCRSGRPGVLVSNLGVFTWPNESSPTMQVESLHPGVTADQVRAATGFDLDIPAGVAETEPPTKDELEALRQVIDPWDYRHGGRDGMSSKTSALIAGGISRNPGRGQR